MPTLPIGIVDNDPDHNAHHDALHRRFNQSYSVLDYGAQGDGVTDDTAAIQDAIDAASSAGGGQVFLPADRTYLLSTVTGTNNVLLVPKSNVSIVGAGDTSVLKVAANLNGVGTDFNLFGPPESTIAYEADHVLFRDFKVDLNGANNQVPAGEPQKKNAVVLIQYGQHITIENLLVVDSPGRQVFSLGTNVAAATVTDVTIRNCRVHGFGSDVDPNQTDHSCVYVRGDRVAVEGNRFWCDTQDTIATAIEVHTQTARIAGNLAENVNKLANLVATVADLTDTQFVDNIGVNLELGVMLWVEPGFVVEGLTIARNRLRLSDGLNAAIDLASNVNAPAHDVAVVDNLVECDAAVSANRGSGVKYGDVTHLTVARNRFVGLLGRALENGADPTADTVHLYIVGNEVIDCGRTSNATTTYRYAFTANSVVGHDTLVLVGNLVVNTDIVHCLQLGIASADFAVAEVWGNHVINVPSEQFQLTGTVTDRRGVVLPIGSATSPSIRFANDPDTGIFQTTAGTVAVATNGVERFRFGDTFTYLLEQYLRVANDAAADDALRTEITGEAGARFRVQSDGKLRWGPGTGVTDVELARGTVGVLSVLGSLYVADDLTIINDLNHDGARAGFFGTAPALKPTVSGSRGGNAALDSLLNALSALGLITDNSTA